MVNGFQKNMPGIEYLQKIQLHRGKINFKNIYYTIKYLFLIILDLTTLIQRVNCSLLG